MTKQLNNETMIRHSLWKWIRIFDKMRADRYAFIDHDKEFSKLEELLEIKQGMPECDRNSIFYKTIVNDFNIWNRYKDGITGRPWATPVYPHEGKTFSEQFPELHGQKQIPYCNPATYLLSNAMYYKKPWSRIIRIYHELLNNFNGLCFPAMPFCNTYGKMCTQHDKAAPTGEWHEFVNTYYDTFGCWQDAGYYYNEGWKGQITWVAQLKIEKFSPPFGNDIPYRIIVAGNVLDAYQFNGMGIAELPGAINVLFDSGPIQGTYTSPLIGRDQIYTSPDIDDFANNSNKYSHAGWQVYNCWLIVIPAEGNFTEYTESES